MSALTDWKLGALVALASAIIAAGAAWTIQGWRYEAQIADIERDSAADRQRLADAALAESERARAIEAAWQKKFEEQEHANQQELARIAANERRAADLRVRDAANKYAADYREAAERATAAAERQAADTAIRMFAELLGETDRLAGIYAAQADRARVAGLACEAAYDSVRQ